MSSNSKDISKGVKNYFMRLLYMDKAILVGICYKGTKSELTSPKYDVENIKKLLMEKFNFNSENILTLSEFNENELPTRENILKHLNQAAGEDNLERLFFYFSGHGSRVRNTMEKDEENEDKDQVICCLGNEYIIDDELHDLFAKFKKEQKVFSVVDSCYSGTIADLNFIYDGDFKVTKTKKREVVGNIVQLSSSIDTKVAWGTTTGGIMSQAFIEIVNKSERLTYFNLMSQLSEKIKKWETPFLSSSYKLNKDSTFFCSKKEKPFIKV